MKDINVLKHTSVDHLPLTGGTMTGAILPNRNGLDLGSNTNRWSNVFANDLQITRNANIGGGVYATGHIKGQDFFQLADAKGLGVGLESKNDSVFLTSVQNGAINHEIMEFSQTAPGDNRRDIFLHRHIKSIGRLDSQLWCGDLNGKWWAVAANQGTIQTSDKNCKSDIREVSHDGINKAKNGSYVPTSKDFYDLIKNMNMVTYVMNQKGKPNTQEDCDSSQLSVGFLAQDVKKINEDVSKFFIVEDGDFIGLNNYHYTSAVHIALQETIGRLENLNKENEELREKLDNIGNAGQNSTVTTLWNSVKDLKKENEELKNELAKMQGNAISALWNAVKDLKKENEELKSKVK